MYPRGRTNETSFSRKSAVVFAEIPDFEGGVHVGLLNIPSSGRGRRIARMRQIDKGENGQGDGRGDHRAGRGLKRP